MSGIAERLAVITEAAVEDWKENGGDLDTILMLALLPVVEREIAAARGEALREAAEEIERVERIGQTSAIETATAELEWFHEHPLRNVDGYQRHRPVVADWLRDRAALSPDPDRGEGEVGGL